MRLYLTISLLLISLYHVAQNQLVLSKNDKGLEKKIKSTNAELSAVTDLLTLKNFDEEGFNIDSIVQSVAHLKNLKKIEFSGCNLMALNISLELFPMLEKIKISHESTYFESTLFPLLTKNNIKLIKIQTHDPDLILDSLYLLGSLEEIHIGNNTMLLQNSKSHSEKISYKSKNGKVNTIELSIYGHYYESSWIRDDLEGKTYTRQFKNKLKCLNPPIPGININDTLYEMNSSSQGSFTYYSGSRIIIDKDAFVDEKGNPYNGTVSIFYREFRDPVEIMLSGIPMTNEENGEKKLFKSGGMYEILAYDINNRLLETKTDTSVKISFAVTDTSEGFKFFSLNNDGNWSVTNNTVSIVKRNKVKKSSEAVRAYFDILRSLKRDIADTTNYSKRFYSSAYLNIYRKDNLFVTNDSIYKFVYEKKLRNNGASKAKGFFKIKYVGKTKDKEIVFCFVPVRKDMRLPLYMNAVMNTNFIFPGEITINEFKKMYCNSKSQFWDMRNNGLGNTINLTLKTSKNYLEITGIPIRLKEKGEYTILKRRGININQLMARQLIVEARKFDRRIKGYNIYALKSRFNYYYYNNINPELNKLNAEKLAFETVKKRMTEEEKNMSFEKWKNYASVNMPNSFDFMKDSYVGEALLKSGMGIKNIDEYLHRNLMQDILVKLHDIHEKENIYDKCIMLYKNINTSYPMNLSVGVNSYTGYAFKNGNNYFIRFDDKGYMQVARPNDLNSQITSGTINLSYNQQYNVTGLNSKQIKSLIFYDDSK